jgi:hypothetical protein
MASTLGGIIRSMLLSTYGDTHTLGVCYNIVIGFTTSRGGDAGSKAQPIALVIELGDILGREVDFETESSREAA